jgi:hypothetical protein
MENKDAATSPTDNSVLEKPSPPPESIKDDGQQLQKETAAEADEAQYPGLTTKLLVGVGLGLAVFLVTPL